MLEGIVRVDKRGNDSVPRGLDFCNVFGTEFPVHAKLRGESFEIIDEYDTLNRINGMEGIKPNAYSEWFSDDGARMAQLYSLSDSEHERAIDVQDNYFGLVMLGK